MILIEEYIKKSLLERQAHLKLDEPCIERGGIPEQVSYMMRGMVANLFDTTMPKGTNTVLVCHACNNNKCYNINHVYWGTAQENRLDAKANGALSVYQYTVAKHGKEFATELVRKNGKSNKGRKYKTRIRKETPAQIFRRSEESRKLMSIKKEGSKNNRFGTCWIYNSSFESRSIQRSDLEKFLEQGWVVGRKMKPVSSTVEP